MLLQNLNEIELTIYLKRSFTGSQLICSNSFHPICALLFKIEQNRLHLVWSICNFNLLFKLNKYQAEQVYQNGAVSKSYKAIYKEVETRTCFFSMEI